MKQQWLNLAARIDALSLRERVLVLLAAMAAVGFLLHQILIAPQLAQRQTLTAQLRQQETQSRNIEADIAARIAAYKVDPDQATLAQLAQLRGQTEAASNALRAVRQGLVTPEQMVPVLQQILRANGKLRLVSLRSLPVSGLSGAAMAPPPAQAAAVVPMGQIETKAEAVATLMHAAQAAAASAPAPAAAIPGAVSAPAKPRELLYRHGVELVLQGSYLDMLTYMEALEKLPVQLFWGKAHLQAAGYPDLKLSLTLYTLSLDEKWMSL
ncbi:hypothetical protein [Massilia sp. NR 4-1]|uniref:hypothetical protein n=1 Tax=Massilia sp. NR 4-1 TaxID=1678028 RepID=UPI00067C224B|nr:hypothetical protein [Massilia sp. NR 4-1]AKU21352.1 hypothetical protein ACZ75_07525 [Massilia sp. NR 4-1]